jgi:hypothetical protein
MRRTIALIGFMSILATGAVSLIAVPTGATRAAAGEATFLIPASDGYGVADCLTTASECGEVVANAWCESQGYGRAKGFGVAAAEDYTGSIGARGSERPIAITCMN